MDVESQSKLIDSIQKRIKIKSNDLERNYNLNTKLVSLLIENKPNEALPLIENLFLQVKN
jgi:hypothetical protein